MHNTKDDVALMNSSRKNVTNVKMFAFPQPQYVLGMFLNFGHYSNLLLVLIKRVHYSTKIKLCDIAASTNVVLCLISECIKINVSF